MEWLKDWEKYVSIGYNIILTIVTALIFRHTFKKDKEDELKVIENEEIAEYNQLSEEISTINDGMSLIRQQNQLEFQSVYNKIELLDKLRGSKIMEIEANLSNFRNNYVTRFNNIDEKIDTLAKELHGNITLLIREVSTLAGVCSARYNDGNNGNNKGGN